MRMFLHLLTGLLLLLPVSIRSPTSFISLDSLWGSTPSVLKLSINVVTTAVCEAEGVHTDVST